MYKIIPLHKSGSSYTTNSYRPISIFSTISKVFEKLLGLYVRLKKFLSRSNVIIERQFGLDQVYSSDMAVADLYRLACCKDIMMKVISLTYF